MCLSLLLVIGGVIVSSDDRRYHSIIFLAFAFILGIWIVGQLCVKGSVLVVAWEVRGPVAVILALLGALLAAISAYQLFMSAFRH
jgi:hypothetical protein